MIAKRKLHFFTIGAILNLASIFNVFIDNSKKLNMIIPKKFNLFKSAKK
jgi:hypothetical protein